MGEGGRSVVESRVRETAQWRYGGKPLTFHRRAQAVRSCITFALRAIWPEEKFEVSPLRSARWPACAPVEMTGFLSLRYVSSGSGSPLVSGAKASVTIPMRKITHIVIAE